MSDRTRPTRSLYFALTDPPRARPHRPRAARAAIVPSSSRLRTRAHHGPRSLPPSCRRTSSRRAAPRRAALVRPHLQSVGSSPRTRWTAYEIQRQPYFVSVSVRPIGSARLDRAATSVSSIFLSHLANLSPRRRPETRGKEFPRPKEDAEVLNDLKYVTNSCSFPHPCSSLLSFFFLFPSVSLALPCLLVLLYRFHNITFVLSRSLVAGHTLPTNVRPSKNGATALGTSRAGERRGRRATRFAGGHVSPARPTNRRTD